MRIAEIHDCQSAQRPAAGVGGGIGIDKDRCHAAEAARTGDRRDIPRIPAASHWIVGAPKPGRFAASDQADDGDGAMHLSGRAAGDGATIGRHEAPVDQYGAGRADKWRQHPEAVALFGQRLDQGFAVMKEAAGQADAAIVFGIVHTGGESDRGGVNPPIHPLDQVALPGPPLDLPEAEAQENKRRNQREADRQPPRQGAPSIPVIGIMFELRWYIIHSEPAITMMTITAVKAKAISVQPPSARVSTWRKKTV